MSKRTSGPSEKSISQAIVRYLNDLPTGHARKVHGGPYGTIGEPDVDACISGRCVKIEVKRPETRANVTPHQQRALDAWDAAGAVSFVAVSLVEVVERLVVEGLVERSDPTVDSDRRS